MTAVRDRKTALREIGKASVHLFWENSFLAGLFSLHFNREKPSVLRMTFPVRSISQQNPTQ